MTADQQERTAGMPRVQAFALDCPDAKALAEFYAAVTGGQVTGEGEWVEVHTEHGPALAFQQVSDFQAPAWPNPERPQQAHLDFAVEDLDEGEAHVLNVGARKHEVQPDSRWRVFLDPVDHPFCLVPA